MRYAEDKASRLEGMGTEHMLSQNGPSLKFWESYSAFANSGGGSIVVTFTGRFDSDVDETIDMIWSGLADRSIVSSNILMDSDIVRTSDGFTVNVPSADKSLRPMYINDSFKTGTFVRHEGKTVRSSIENVLSMIRDSSDIYDVPVHSEFDFSIINMGSVKAFRSLVHSGHIWEGLTDEEFLFMTGLITNVDGYTKLTKPGILLFSDHYTASSIYPGYRLRYSDGKIKLDSEEGRWSGNIFDFYSLVSERIDATFNSINDYLKEIVINALAHSDYFFGEGISITCDDDSFIVVNSGLFRSDQKASVNGERGRRNPTLTKILGMILSKRGLGNAISSLNGSGYEVSIKEDFVSGSVTVIVKSSIIPKTSMNPVEERILDGISTNQRITIDEMSQCIGLSRRQVERYIAELKSKGILVREGSRRAGNWRIL